MIKYPEDVEKHRQNGKLMEELLRFHGPFRKLVAMVANESRFVESCLSKIVDQLRVVRDACLVDYKIELL